MKNTFTFPGQGSQAVGMGSDLAKNFPEAKQVFEEVDDALGQKLSTIMWEGPIEDLTLTANAQPALMAVSVAVTRVLEAKLGDDLWSNTHYVAGHSLGEYSALSAAGALTVTDTAKLLRTRGNAMQNAVPVGQGAMAAILGINLPEAEEIAKISAQGDVCQAANDNAPGQVVISGAKAAVERAVAIAPDHGARRAVLLPVSAPFHCALMQPAQDEMAEALASATINAPKVPLIANVIASDITDPEEIRARLIEQVTGMVRWRETVEFMVEKNIDTIFELGAGKVLTGIARRIARDANGVAVETADDIEKAIDVISG